MQQTINLITIKVKNLKKMFVNNKRKDKETNKLGLKKICQIIFKIMADNPVLQDTKEVGEQFIREAANRELTEEELADEYNEKYVVGKATPHRTNAITFQIVMNRTYLSSLSL